MPLFNCTKQQAILAKAEQKYFRKTSVGPKSQTFSPATLSMFKVRNPATRTQVCDNPLMSFGHKIKNKILLRCRAEEAEEILKLDIRIEHLTLGDFYVEG